MFYVFMCISIIMGFLLGVTTVACFLSFQHSSFGISQRSKATFYLAAQMFYVHLGRKWLGLVPFYTTQG